MFFFFDLTTNMALVSKWKKKKQSYVEILERRAKTMKKINANIEKTNTEKFLFCVV